MLTTEDEVKKMFEDLSDEEFVSLLKEAGFEVVEGNGEVIYEDNNDMNLQKGDKIYALDENKTLTVEGFWGNASKFVDFSARYVNAAGVDRYGNKVFGNRGFRFEDEGRVWKRL